MFQCIDADSHPGASSLQLAKNLLQFPDHQEGGFNMIQFKQFLSEETGATMIEYSVIVALFGVIALAALGSIASPLGTTFNTLSAAMTGTP